jgi:hypothetical protein
MPNTPVATEDFVYANRDDGASYTVHGRLIGHGDSKDDGRPRWVEVDIIAVEGGGYALHRVGASRVYHRAGNTTCRQRSGAPSGLPATKDDLPPDAVSCDLCEPPWLEDLDDGEEVLFEFPRHNVKAFENPLDVATDLFTVRGRSGSKGTQVSRPGWRALVQARENDDAFAQVSTDITIGRGQEPGK